MRRLFLIAAVIVTVATTVSLALAQSGPLEIPWYTIDGGGTTASSGGDFALSGTVGQPDAGISSGGIFAARGGFWGVAPVPDIEISTVYLPLIRK
jgi:hypothetical protein